MTNRDRVRAKAYGTVLPSKSNRERFLQIAYPETAYEKTAYPSENTVQPSKNAEGGYTTQQRNRDFNSFQSTNDFARNRLADFTQVQTAAKNGKPFPLQPAALNVYARQAQIEGLNKQLAEVSEKKERAYKEELGFGRGRVSTDALKARPGSEYAIYSTQIGDLKARIAATEKNNAHAETLQKTLRDNEAMQKDIKRLSAYDIDANEAELEDYLKMLEDVNDRMDELNYDPQILDNLPADIAGQREKEYTALDLYQKTYEEKIASLREDIKNAKYVQDMNHYSGLRNNRDFGEKSKYGATPTYTGEENPLEILHKYMSNPDNMRRRYPPEIMRLLPYMNLNDEEKSSYNYLFNTEGKKAAEAFANIVAFARIGREKGESLATEKGFSAGVERRLYDFFSGVSDFAYGAKDMVVGLSGQAKAEQPDVNDYMRQGYYDNLNQTGRLLSDVFQGVGKVAPALAVGAINPAAGAAVMGFSSAGSNFQNELNSGKDYHQAMAYGIVSGAVDAGMQYALGGIGKLGKMTLSSWTSKLLTNVGGRLASNPLVRSALPSIAGAAGQYTQDYLAYNMQPILRNMLLDERNQIKPFSEEALYHALVGVIISTGVNAATGEYSRRVGGVLGVDDGATPGYNGSVKSEGAWQSIKIGNESVELTGKNVVGTSYNKVKPTQDWINTQQINDYIKRLKMGEKLSPIEIYQVPGKGYFIQDGHHRFVASQITGIPVEVRILPVSGPVGLSDWTEVSP